MAKINYRKICIHRTYSVKEIAELLHIVEKTCFRWIDDGLRTIPEGKKPILIKGNDLKEFLMNRKLKKKKKLNRNQFFCMTCKDARYAKRGSIGVNGNNKTALCRVCNGKMNKKFKLYQKD